MRRRTIGIGVLLACSFLVTESADAQRGRGGARGGGARGGGGFRGGGGARSVARPSVTRPGGFGGGTFGGGSRPQPIQRPNLPNNRPGGVINSGGDVIGNRRTVNNVDVNRNIDVDNGWGWNGCCYRGGAALAGAAVGAAITAAAIGTVYTTLPTNCVVSVVNGVTYEQCGSAWLLPRFEGTETTYVVVDPP